MTQQNVHIFLKQMIVATSETFANIALAAVFNSYSTCRKAMQMLHNFKKVIILQLLKNYVKPASSKISFSFSVHLSLD